MRTRPFPYPQGASSRRLLHHLRNADPFRRGVSLYVPLRQKDVFYDVFGYLEPSSVSQQNYTTADGVNVLLLKSSSSGMILVDRENQFLALGIDGDAPLEQIAECFDFTIHPNAPDAAAADAREQASQEEMRSRMGDLNITPLLPTRNMWRT